MTYCTQQVLYFIVNLNIQFKYNYKTSAKTTWKFQKLKMSNSNESINSTSPTELAIKATMFLFYIEISNNKLLSFNPNFTLP